MTKKISVIIPSYNHQNFIEETINSVINQTYENLEIIVIDDGSCDQSYSKISNIADERLKIFHQENQGAHNTINRGLEIATGDYIAILNSDDIYHPQRLEECIKLADINQGNALIASDIEVINAQGETLGIKKSFKNMLPYEIDNLEKTFISTLDPSQNIIMFNYVATTSNFFFHHDIYQHLGKFNCLRYTHDWDYLLRLIQDYQIKIIEKPLLKYRVHSSNTIKENQSRMILEICWTLAKNLPDILSNVCCLNITPNQDKPEEIIEFFYRLYNSIRIYNCEKILLNLILLFQVLKQNNMDNEIMSIIDPNNNYHQELINEINNCLHQNKYSNSIIKTKIDNNKFHFPWKSQIKSLIKQFFK